MIIHTLKNRRQILSGVIILSVGCCGFWIGNPLAANHRSSLSSRSQSEQSAPWWVDRGLGSAVGTGVGMLVAHSLSVGSARIAKSTDISQTDRLTANLPTPDVQDLSHRMDKVSQPVQLSDLQSLPYTLTPEQRETLQCLLILGAERCLSLAVKSPNPTPNEFEMLSSSDLAMLKRLQVKNGPDVRQLLSAAGYSSEVIDRAWRMIHDPL
jgi:hypothetical protein